MQIFDLGGSEAVDTLVRITNDSDPLTSRRQKLHKLKLNNICVLKLINQQGLDVGNTFGMFSQQVRASYQQVVVV